MDYKKDFDRWNAQKKEFDARKLPNDFNFHEGEIWWMTIGVNIGAEIDGKHDNFERPGLIIKIISKETMYIVPLTSRLMESKYCFVISYANREGCLIFSQVRLLSHKRLLRKITAVEKSTLREIRHRFIKVFQ